MKKSIFGKLLLSHIAVILVSAATLGILMAYFVQGYVESDRRRIFLDRVNAAVTIIDPIVAEGGHLDNLLLDAVSRMGSGIVWIIGNDGSVIAGRMPRNLTEEDKERIAAFSIAFGQKKDIDNTESQELILNSKNNDRSAIVLAKPLPSDQSKFLVLYTPQGGGRRNITPLHELLLYSLAAGIITSVIVGFFISRNFTRTIASISLAASCFAKGDYQSRITTTTEDEIGQLGKTFNSMAEELSRIEQNRRDFLSNVSHELKTPITSIQVLAEAVLDGLVKDESERQRYLNNILAETRRISRLINDLLELSQLESGQLSVTCVKLDLKEAVGYVEAQMGPFLTMKNLNLKYREQLDNIFVWADPDRLNQVLTNLLTNAIRYSFDNSSIVIDAVVKDSSTYNEVSISVVNCGSGILPDEIPYIWERFYRVDKSRSRLDGGTGLGLSITKKLVEAMRGSISVQSIPGETTTFTFTLPRS